MINGRSSWKPLIQKAVTGQAGRFSMTGRLPEWPGLLKAPGLYLHVPFCRSLCPYCPYNRVRYDESLFNLFAEAVKEEISLYAPCLSGQVFSSLYIGGGTPTVNLSGLTGIIRHLRQRLPNIGRICVELHPGSMDYDGLAALKEAGVTMLSIGVESTSDELLQRIGRSHDARSAIGAVSRALSMGFKAVNVDLMFALPGQRLADWENDIRTVVDLGVDQLSTYPLFTFAYSDRGMRDALREVKRPSGRTIRAMLRCTDAYCEHKGLQRCAVWSWLKPGKEKFSSTTRHHYIGFGPSAASMTGTDFYVNTFDVKAYAAKLPAQRPVAVSMPVSRRLEMAYWLYWRMYELSLSSRDFCEVFGTDLSMDQLFGHLLRPLMPLGLIRRTGENYSVTKRGAYWIHRLQNEYSLRYINRLWGTCRRQAWPEEVVL